MRLNNAGGIYLPFVSEAALPATTFPIVSFFFSISGIYSPTLLENNNPQSEHNVPGGDNDRCVLSNLYDGDTVVVVAGWEGDPISIMIRPIMNPALLL